MEASQDDHVETGSSQLDFLDRLDKENDALAS